MGAGVFELLVSGANPGPATHGHACVPSGDFAGHQCGPVPQATPGHELAPAEDSLPPGSAGGVHLGRAFSRDAYL